MFKPRLRLCDGRLLVAAVGSALLLSLQAAAGPGGNSVADVGACLEDADTARVCSSKELSNVVLQCGDESSSTYIKYDDLDDTEAPFEGLESPFEGLFSCPEGEIIAVFIKSGSGKYDGAPIADLPPGSGAQWLPLACTDAEASCTDGSDGGDEGGDVVTE
jgi:hypothetical protein